MDPETEEAEFLEWMLDGGLRTIDPHSQFEFDHDVERSWYQTPWPWEQILAKWRPIAFDLWRTLGD
jgi:hypothetical protein